LLGAADESTAVYRAMAMIAITIIAHMKAKLSQLCVLASEWSAQTMPHPTEHAAKRKMMSRLFIAQPCRGRS
jgi:hypothetical protein